MSSTRWDETWHRLREWTNGQGPSERLAALVLLKEGFQALDPSHPLGGQDGGRDAICGRDCNRWVMAVYFPRGQKPFPAIKQKFQDDLKGARENNAVGFAFVTNQEITISQRRDLRAVAEPEDTEIYHLERITTILDSPDMAAVRKQFLAIDYDPGLYKLGKTLKDRWRTILMSVAAITFLIGGGLWAYLRYAPPSSKAVAQAIERLREATLGSTPPDLGHALAVLRRAEVALGGENLEGAWIACQNFSDLDMRRVHASKLHGTGVRFRNALLFSANLENSELNSASFRDADMQHARLDRSNMVGASLRYANARGISAREATLQGASLEQADLVGADLSKANLTFADLRGANLAGANLSGTIMEQADLSGANLEGARNLEQAMLDRACAAPSEPPRLDASLNHPTRACDPEEGSRPAGEPTERQIARALMTFVAVQEVIQGTCRQERVEPRLFDRNGRPRGEVFVPLEAE